MEQKYYISCLFDPLKWSSVEYAKNEYNLTFEEAIPRMKGGKVCENTAGQRAKFSEIAGAVVFQVGQTLWCQVYNIKNYGMWRVINEGEL